MLFLQFADEVEEIVFNAVISWTNYDLENRKQFLAVLLEKVDFNKMSATFLKNVVSKNVSSVRYNLFLVPQLKVTSLTRWLFTSILI